MEATAFGSARQRMLARRLREFKERRRAQKERARLKRASRVRRRTLSRGYLCPPIALSSTPRNECSAANGA